MGCICSKGNRLNEFIENQKGNKKIKSRKFSKWFGSSPSGKEEADQFVGNDATTAGLIPGQLGDDNVGFTPSSPFDGERKSMFSRRGASKQQLQRRITIGSHVSRGQAHGQLRSPATFLGTPGGERGAQVVAGWPSWLSSVAGEAISGWVPRKADSFEKLDKIGQGTYSSVYRARDLETGKIVALKKVRFANMDPESVRFMVREITILRRLDHPNVMKLEGLISSRNSNSMYLVFDYMEHDLAGLASTPGIKLSESQIKCYMKQLLHGLEHCHSHGVLHRDIKGSNLLIDNNGSLKIGDFGLSTFFGPQQKQPLTSRVVTLWYRPPELLLGATDYGVAVDLWSAGCILAELFAGKPIMSGRTEVEQLHKIFKLCGSPSEEYWKKSKLPHATIFKPQQPYKRCFADTYKDFPASTLKLLNTLLAVEPDCRGTASAALQSEFFTTKPLPCNPSSLPKYPPCKELDVKLREEESKRRKATSCKGRGHESMINFPRDSKAVLAPDGANAELPASINHNPLDEGSRLPTNSLKGPELRTQRSCINPGAAQLSRFSNSVADRGGSRFDSVRDATLNSHFGDNDSCAKREQRHHLLDGQKASTNMDEQLPGKDSATGYVRKNKIHCSGTLADPGGNVEEMLKEREKQMQNAVRRARQDKVKAKKINGENGQTESLLHDVKSGS